MAKQIFVVETLADWKPMMESGVEAASGQAEVVHADDYLTGRQYYRQKNLQVVNLCRSYRYLSVGYYCSLLGEARGHRVLPSVGTMLDLSRKALYGLESDLDAKLDAAIRRHVTEGETRFELEIFFGWSRIDSLAALARRIFESFPAPLLQVSFRYQGRWRIDNLRSLGLRKLSDEQRAFFREALARFRTTRRRQPKDKPAIRYDLAVLHDPKEKQPPSNERALKNLIKAGARLGIAVDLVERKDYPRLAEYDALFIRETTRIDHHTYRFARKAAAEGMVVIDDPRSIQLCTNKVYLAELLRGHSVPTPHTVILGRGDLKAAENAIGYPMVIKVPDGSFSQGVFKVEERKQLEVACERLFKDSELLLAQEFLYTEYDWRIGVLNREPLYASQYFMSKKHWQIVHYDGKGGFTEGAFKTVPVEQAPVEVVQTALKAANLIGDGLYGVDMKQNADGVYVIEVNDNPNIEAGVEDLCLKDELYSRIMGEFLRRLELRHGR